MEEDTGSRTGRRILVGCGVLFVVVTLLLGTLLVYIVSTASGEGSATIRISGTEGVTFEGHYETDYPAHQTTNAEGRTEYREYYAEGQIGSTPTEYEAPIETGWLSGAGNYAEAFIRKREPSDGTLKVELLVDGRLVDEDETTGTDYVIVNCYGCR